MTNENEVKNFFKTFQTQYKSLEILINVVGQSEPGGPTEINTETWENNLD